MPARCPGLLVLTLLPALLGTGCTTPLQHDLPEGEANRILVALAEADIAGAKERAGRGRDAWTVRVPRGDATRAYRVLAAHDLPRPATPTLETLYGEPRLIPTPTEERARFLAALGGELARTLETIDGVIDARVHVVLPTAETPGRSGSAGAPTAAVLIKYRARPDQPPPCSAEQVRALVAGGVEDLAPEGITVLLTPAHEAQEAPGPGVVQVAGLGVSRGSAALLRWVLAGICLLLVLLALALAHSRLLLRRARSSGGRE